MPAAPSAAIEAAARRPSLSAPVLIFSLGLFAIVINMAVLWITTLLTDRIEIEGFWSYLCASLIISIVTMILHAVLPARSYQRAG